MSFDARILTGVGVLATVTEVGNFARAAEVLGLTPSGVSRAVARLEARIGVRLFDRTPRSVTLTEEGRRFHKRPVAPRRFCGAQVIAFEINNQRRYRHLQDR
jgi:DNA-binding MarR family transcriptional regulator